MWGHAKKGTDIRFLLPAAAAAALLSYGALAAPVLTQDATAFAIATAGLSFTIETFDALPDESGLASKDLGDVTVVPTDGDVEIATHDTFCLAGKCLFALIDGVTFTFDSPVSAFGFYLGDGDGLTSDVLVDGSSIGSINTTGATYSWVSMT